MSEARIERLPEDRARSAAEEVGLPETMAPLSAFRVLLHHPELAKAISDLLTTLMFRGHLDRRLRELVILRIGWATGACYEWTQHWRVARALDIEERDLLAVRDWRNSHLGAAERAVLQATDDTLERGAIRADTWLECCSHLPTPQEQLELVAAIGNWTLFSQLLRSLEIPLEEGLPAWPPDGESPPARSE